MYKGGQEWGNRPQEAQRLEQIKKWLYKVIIASQLKYRRWKLFCWFKNWKRNHSEPKSENTDAQSQLSQYCYLKYNE